MSDDLDRMIRGLNRIKAAQRGDAANSAPTVRTVVFGRSPDCDVVVDDEYVSPRHCAISELEDGRVVVEDLGSTNGTTVRYGSRPAFQVYARAPIGPGSTIRIGRTDLPWRPLSNPDKENHR